jgi:hypothetical protein
VVHKRCPWKSFKKRFDCELAGSVAIVTRRSNPSDIQTVRQFAAKDSKNIIKALRSLRHEMIFSAAECFHFDGIFYIVSEFYPLTLEHIVACKAFPNERQLAAIMEQVSLTCIFPNSHTTNMVDDPVPQWSFLPILETNQTYFSEVL